MIPNMKNILIRRVVLTNVKNINLRFMATRKEDVCTHTGQRWDCDDYRMARFLNSPKVVNPNWPVELIKCVAPKQVIGRKTWCDGDMGAEGHPRVYINMDAPGPQFCMYCSQLYIRVTVPVKQEPVQLGDPTAGSEQEPVKLQNPTASSEQEPVKLGNPTACSEQEPAKQGNPIDCSYKGT